MLRLKKKSRQSPPHFSGTKVAFFACLVVFCFLAVLGRAFQLQFLDRSQYDDMAKTKNFQLSEIQVHRGKILDREGNLLAASLPSPSVYLLKNRLGGSEGLSRTCRILKLDCRRLEAKIRKRSGNYVSVKHNVGKAEERALKAAKPEGVYFAPDFARYYPSMFQASPIIGITGKYSKGREGIEYKYDDVLMGRSEYHESPLDAVYSNDLRNAQGLNVHLTLSEPIQYQTEKHLKRAVARTDAISGVAIVMETHTGRILAMANTPGFDPNRYQDFSGRDLYNRAVGDSYEPGSIFKVITIAIARQGGFIRKDDEFYAENGVYHVLGHQIRDSTGRFGILSIAEIVRKSSNIGAIKIGESIPRRYFHERILDFGFKRKTGVGLPEQKGVVHDYRNWSDSDLATISFGHSLLVTPIQLISAINSIANFGLYVRPFVVERFTDEKNEVVMQTAVEARRVLDEEIAEEVAGYMEKVVERGGTGFRARLENVAVAGKTGTTQKYDRRTNKYSNENHIVSFAGFLPAKDPVLTILVIINEPQKALDGSKSAAGVFKQIASAAYNVYNPQNVEIIYSAPDRIGEFASVFKPKERGPVDFNRWKGLFMREALHRAFLMEKELYLRGSGVVAERTDADSGRRLFLKFEE